MNFSTKFSNISMSEKAKNRGLKIKHYFLVNLNYLISIEMRCKPCFNGYNGINRSHENL